MTEDKYRYFVDRNEDGGGTVCTIPEYMVDDWLADYPNDVEVLVIRKDRLPKVSEAPQEGFLVGGKQFYNDAEPDTLRSYALAMLAAAEHLEAAPAAVPSEEEEQIRGLAELIEDDGMWDAGSAETLARRLVRNRVRLMEDDE